MRTQSQTDMVRAITEIATSIPWPRVTQLYDFAIFLKTHPLPTEETTEEITTDEERWSSQFAATDNNKLDALVASVEAEIDTGKTLPMFDKHGEFVEQYAH